MKEEQEELLKEREKNKRAEEQAVNQLMNCIRRPYELQLDYHNRLKTLAGNMQTLKLPKNTAMKNDPFETKRTRYQRSPFYITRKVGELEEWRKADFDKRQKEMTETLTAAFKL